ncbi:hypothetical protein BDZ89DRAFT_1073973 [Hymenopellis radicata]|nr:hypothetical protein BDZ89DRAFT_1073973 [Hymenopellis radicata]
MTPKLNVGECTRHSRLAPTTWSDPDRIDNVEGVGRSASRTRKNGRSCLEELLIAKNTASFGEEYTAPYAAVLATASATSIPAGTEIVHRIYGIMSEGRWALKSRSYDDCSSYEEACRPRRSSARGSTGDKNEQISRHQIAAVPAMLRTCMSQFYPDVTHHSLIIPVSIPLFSSITPSQVQSE